MHFHKTQVSTKNKSAQNAWGFTIKHDDQQILIFFQGSECAGQRLLIKFPDNPLSNGNVVLRKGASQSAPHNKKWVADGS